MSDNGAISNTTSGDVSSSTTNTTIETTNEIPHRSIDHLNHFHTKDLKVAPHFRRITRDSVALKLGLSSPSDNLSPFSQRLMYDDRIKKVKPKSLKNILMKPFTQDGNENSLETLKSSSSQSKLHNRFSSDSLNCEDEPYSSNDSDNDDIDDETPEQLMMNTDHDPTTDSPLSHKKSSKEL